MLVTSAGGGGGGGAAASESLNWLSPSFSLGQRGSKRGRERGEKGGEKGEGGREDHKFISGKQIAPF